MSITTDEEQDIWRHVATRLEELHEQVREPVLSEGEERSRHHERANPAAVGDESPVEGDDRLSTRSDRGLGRNTRAFLSVALVPDDAFDPVHPPSFATRIHARARHRPRSRSATSRCSRIRISPTIRNSSATEHASRLTSS